LRRWLKSPSVTNFDIRTILDWDYYIERLGGTIQKIITIPAALQGVSNPVPRVKHPDWLHKKLMEKNDVFKQKRISEMFTSVSKDEMLAKQKQRLAEVGEDKENAEEGVKDMEDLAGKKRPKTGKNIVTVKGKKRQRSGQELTGEKEINLTLSWKEALGNPPPMGDTREEMQAWLAFHKKKWAFQKKQKVAVMDDNNSGKRARTGGDDQNGPRPAGLVRTSVQGEFHDKTDNE
jgi:DNA polymerase epsilon subunit 1